MLANAVREFERAPVQVDQLLLVLAHSVKLLVRVGNERRGELVVATDEWFEMVGAQPQRIAGRDFAQQRAPARESEFRLAAGFALRTTATSPSTLTSAEPVAGSSA